VVREYAVDLALCIDKTSSMSPILERVKQNALRLVRDIKKKMGERANSVTQVRARVIAFGDIYADKDRWLLSSDFFNLSDEYNTFKAFVNGVTPGGGGGDAAESGLEAVSLAIKSNWSSAGHFCRYLIAMWTDAPAHKLEKRAVTDLEIPEALPTNMRELNDLWDRLGQGRMIIFAPDAYPWTDLSVHLDRVWLVPTRAGEGMREHEYEDIVKMLTMAYTP
jgi:hypothetical protein